MLGTLVIGRLIKYVGALIGPRVITTAAIFAECAFMKYSKIEDYVDN